LEYTFEESEHVGGWFAMGWGKLTGKVGLGMTDKSRK